jgi:bifunctional ADP-heptose synthase (sugar kinase/adenylyltransferase)
MAKDRIIITCGYFDPLSIEELKFLKRCRAKGDWLIVGVHSDWYMMWAQGGFVQNYQTRREILSNINAVDEIMTFNDSDGTVCQLLKIAKICYPDAMITYISQEDMKDMPEMKIKGIKFETLK